MKKTTFFLSLFCVFAASCTPENWIGGSRVSSSSIVVNVTDVNNASTRSEAAAEQLFDSFVFDTIGGQEIRMDAYVSDICLPVELDEMNTRGSITTTSKLTQFWMNGYAEGDWFDSTVPEGEKGSRTNPYDAGDYFIKSNCSKSGSEWTIAGDPKWLNDIDISFWSWAGVSAFSGTNQPTVNADHDELSFGYVNTGDVDLIFAYNKEKRTCDNTGEIKSGTGTYDSNSKDEMTVKFYHALSFVRFDVSELIKNDITIKKITVKNVLGQVTCTVTPQSDGSLEFEYAEVTGADKASFSRTLQAEDFTETGYDGTTSDALMPITSDKVIFLIPQTVKDQGIKVEIEYSEGSSSTTETSEASLNHDKSWVAGKFYTYRLEVNKTELTLTVDDEIVDNVKKNLTIKYEGTKSAFVRASITAYWVDASGNYLLNCDYKNEGTLVGLATAPWSEGSDGFFYYEDEVESGDDVGPSLLTSYAPPVAPISGATLRMVITAQATVYDSGKTCYEAFEK